MAAAPANTSFSQVNTTSLNLPTLVNQSPSFSIGQIGDSTRFRKNLTNRSTLNKTAHQTMENDDYLNDDILTSTSSKNPFVFNKNTERLLIQNEVERSEQKKHRKMNNSMSYAPINETSQEIIEQTKMSDYQNQLVSRLSQTKRQGKIKQIKGLADISTEVDSHLSPRYLRPIQPRSTQRKGRPYFDNMSPDYTDRNSSGLRYIKKHSPREQIRDVIDGTRKMLYTQLSIENKTEETQKLREYILMENEKLVEAKKSFFEDQDRFNKYMSEMNALADRAAQLAQINLEERRALTRETEDLKAQVKAKKRRLEAVDEELIKFKRDKEFLNEVANTVPKTQW